MIDTAGNPGFQNQFYNNNNNMNNNQGPLPNPGPQIMVSDNRNTQQETRTPPSVTSSPPTSQTSAPISNIDWTQYLGMTTTTTTTKKPATNFNTAIDGEGILQPRIFE